MTPDDITDALVHALGTHNPWWSEGAAALRDDLPSREKSDFYHLARPDAESSQFEDAPVVGLVGQHGVGKTTLLKQFIHHQITSGAEPERFCYVPLDANALYQLHSPAQLRQVRRYYESRILGRLEAHSPHFLVLDDVHRIAHGNKPSIDGWGSVVQEALRDGDGRHVVVTAGATEHVTEELDRSGFQTDAFDVQPILPEKFRDYVFTRHPALEDADRRVSPTPVRAGAGSLPHAAETGDVAALVETLRDQYQRVADVSRRIQSQVVHYLAMGGVLSYVADDAPDATAVDTDDYHRLEQNLTATLYQDAPSLESVQTVADLDRLTALAAHTCGTEPIRFQRLVDLFDVDRRTIRDSYISVLEQLFVLAGVTEYDNQRPRATRLYLRDTGLVSALQQRSPSDALDDLDYEADLAHVAAFDHTMRLAYGIDAARGDARPPDVQYWRGRSGTVEYVFEVDGTPIPVGLAYRQRDREATLETLSEFVQSYETSAGLLVTGDTARHTDPVASLDDGIVQLPYWLYLMLC